MGETESDLPQFRRMGCHREAIGMKKTAVGALLLWTALFLLGACGQVRSSEPEGDAFDVVIVNRCNERVMGFHYEYLLGSAPAGGGEVYRADGKPIAQGEELTREFTAADFPRDAELSLFSIRFYVVLDDGSERPAGQTQLVPASYGKRYAFVLSGSLGAGFSAVRMEDAQRKERA